MSVDKIYECLQSIPWSPTSSETTNLLSTVRRYLQEYVFLDVAKNPPPDTFTSPIDLLAEFDAIKPSNYEYAIDFYHAINNVIGKVNDPHLSFNPPCTSYLYYLFPYTFSVVGTPPKLVLKSQETLSLSSRHGLEYDSRLNYIIDNMTLTEEFEDGKDPLDIMHEFAEEYVHHSKSPSNRFNYALRNGFGIRSSGTFKPPKPVKFLGRKTADSPTEPFVIDFYGFFNSEYAIDDISALCPLKKNAKVNSDEESPSNATLPKDGSKYDPENEWVRKTDPRFTLHAPPLPQSPQIDTKTTTLSNNTLLVVASDTDVVIGRLDTESHTGYLRISSFSPSSITDFCNAVVEFMKVMKEQNVEKIILDVRENGGGYVQLQSQLLHLLYPSFFPYKQESDRPAGNWPSAYSEMLSKYQEYAVDPDTYQKMKPWKTNVTKTFKEVNGTEYTRQYQPRSRSWLGYNYMEKALKKKWNKKMIKNQHALFAPENVIVLTDGLCGSACSMFAKALADRHLARIVYCGGWPIANPTDIDIGSFGGGTVYSSDSVASVYSTVGRKKENPFPAFEREYTSLSFTSSIAYSLNPDTPDAMWEYAVSEPSAIVSFYDPPLDSTDHIYTVVSLIQPIFGVCDVGMNKNSTKCNSQTQNNRLYSHPCDPDTNKFNEEVCSLSGCVDGYYAQSGTCTAIPVQKLKGVPMNGWGVFWLVFGIVCFSLYALGQLFCCCVCGRK
ncbi:hypothetical protein BLNAU_10054 [Blattamonas nauphoetae]|uniref:Tail specific protease domain-containing protein n=1 Tax=Blattamonas nauphoetae TaxID=2049346 RepID=A0ABQ9XTV9_9EUKA|nr:hypothetical protein BLNAU_10054 [Blattamonas nauphoetae]